MAVTCKHCGAVHAKVERGVAFEQLVYSVMLLDATEKSFFCNPKCYDAYRAEKHPGSYITDEVAYARQQWAARQADAAAVVA